MQRKRRRGDFNELRTLYIYRGRMTDGVIFQFNSPSSVMCNGDAKGGTERGRQRTTAHHWWPRLFPHSPAVLWTTAGMYASATRPVYLRNDHLPEKGPCESHYPWSDLRWQGEGAGEDGCQMTGSAPSDVPLSSPGEEHSDCLDPASQRRGFKRKKQSAL